MNESTKKSKNYKLHKNLLFSVKKCFHLRIDLPISVPNLNRLESSDSNHLQNIGLIDSNYFFIESKINSHSHESPSSSST